MGKRLRLADGVLVGLGLGLWLFISIGGAAVGFLHQQRLIMENRISDDQKMYLPFHDPLDVRRFI
jgi:hypothetical protein